jgi:hypothetical protein
MSEIGRALIVLGVVVVAIGLVMTLADRVPWLGHLPGDLYLKREHFSLYFPLATCVLISLVISLVLYLFRR